MTTNIATLPKYTKREEIQNVISHFIGALFAIGTLVTFIIVGNMKGYSFSYMFPYYIYSLFMLLMFGASSFYHSRPLHSESRAYARMVDHCDIYGFVMATYFPICVHGITNHNQTIALLSIEIGLGILGIVLKLIPIERKSVSILSFLVYIIQGWIIIVFYPFNTGLPFNSFLFVLIGGIIYSIGAILFMIGKYKMWSHTIFHYFVLFAAITQFVGIIFLL